MGFELGPVVVQATPLGPKLRMTALYELARLSVSQRFGSQSKSKYAKEILTLYVKGHPLLNVVPILICPLRIKFSP